MIKMETLPDNELKKLCHQLNIYFKKYLAHFPFLEDQNIIFL